MNRTGITAPRQFLAALGLFALAAPLPAQEIGPIQERIRGELEAKGTLDDLRDAWAAASLEQRVALERADGELRAALALLAPGAHRPRAELLDALGNTEGALGSVEQVLAEAGLPHAERTHWLLRQGELLLASGRGEAGERALGEALSRSPDRAGLIANLAGAYGRYEFALRVTNPGARTGQFASHLTRALWWERRGDLDGAVTEYRAAHQVAATELDKRFALSCLVDLHRRAGRLEELAEELKAQPALEDSQLRALLRILRELSKGRDALALLEQLDPADGESFTLQRQAMDIALESGETGLAVELGHRRLDADPGDLGIRLAMAWLFADLGRRDEAAAILLAGLARGDVADLGLLVRNASELGLELPVAQALAALRSGDDLQRLQAVLLEVDHLGRHERGEAAARLLYAARADFPLPAHRVRLAEALESGGHLDRALSIYHEVYRETPSEDLGMRLAWLLSEGGDPEQDRQAQEIFREIWLNAGSAGRRAQAEERVLSLAARQGTLADLALELEEALVDPDTVNPDAKRQALVKIYTRALDSFGAAEVLMAYAREPGREVDAWQELAKMHLLAEEYRKHERALRHLLEIDPAGELEYLQQLALSSLERRRPAAARQVTEEILERSNSAEAYEFAAGIHALAGRDGEAVRVYRRFLARYPDRIEIRLALAQAMAGDQGREQALGMLAEVLLGEPPDDLFLVAVDGLLNLEAEPAVLGFALRRVRRRLAEQPDKVYLHRALQDLLLSLGDEAGHVLALEETLAVAGPQRNTWLRELMEGSKGRGDTAGYLRHGRAVLDSLTEIPPRVFVELGEAMLQSGQLRGAERAFARARFTTDFAGLEGAVEGQVAALYEEIGRLADAERLRRRILRRQPSNSNALVAVARLVEQRGDRPGALTLYQQAITALPLPVGVSSPEAFAGLLRTASSGADLEPLRTRIQSAPASQAAALAALLADLRRTVFWEDVSPGELGPLEDRLIQANRSRRMRSQVFQARIHRGDLEGAGAAISSHGSEHGPEGFTLAMLAGDLLEARRRVGTGAAGIGNAELGAALAAFHRAGAGDQALELLGRLEQRARLDPISGGEWLLRSRRVLGLAGDDRPLLEAKIRAALDMDPARPRQRVEAVVQATAANRHLEVAERAELLGRVLEDAGRDPNGYTAQVFLDAGIGLLPPELLAPLARLSLESIRQAHLLSTRARYLSVLGPREGAALLETVLDRFPPRGRNTQILRILHDQSVSPEIQELVAAKLRLSPGAPADLYWIARLCTAVPLQPRIAEVLRRALMSQPDKNAYARLLAARLEPDSVSTHLQSALETLRNRTLDATAVQLLAAMVPLMHGAGDWWLANLEDGTVDQFLRGALLAGVSPDRAAEALQAAGHSQPDNLPLVQAVEARLLDLRRPGAALEVYRAFLETRGRIDRQQAAHLARLYLGTGQPELALDSLAKSRDPDQLNRPLELRAIIALEDPGVRGRRLRRWSQEPLPEARVPRLPPARRHDLAKSLGPWTVPAPAPGDPEEALARGTDLDLLGFVPEGREVAEALLATLDAKGREGATDLYRGWLRSAALGGAQAELLDLARRRIQSNPWDGEAMRILFAASQLGWELTGPQAHRALARKALLAGDVSGLVEVMITAHHAGNGELARALLFQVTASRETLTDYGVRGQFGAILALAREMEPDLLLQLLPGAAVDIHLDGALMTALIDHPDLERCLVGFAAVPGFLDRRRTLFSGLRLALPWAGLCLRAGNLPGLRRALTMEDPSVETGDDFPPRALGAAIPPLDLWRDPDLATPLGGFLLEQADRGPFGRRLLFVRLGEVLARRLDESGRGEEAQAMRALWEK